MPLLSLRNLSKRFGSTLAVNDASIEVESGEFFGLLGPSGCGKTTTLRIIAGLGALPAPERFRECRFRTARTPLQNPNASGKRAGKLIRD